jgi:ubiquinone/menaquinone biosynthesis C-methylase UbiE
MNHAPTAYMDELLAPFAPTRPVAELVVEVNRIFHTFEAGQYDGGHPEIHDQLPGVWRELVATVAGGRRDWSVLDVGAGTGFASEQALRNLPEGAVRALTCFDLSSEMLERCRARIAPLAPQTSFVTALPRPPASFDLLLTNSVLHHLPDVDATLREIEQVLAPGAWWISGHEPSSRFYRNPACCAHLERYRRHNRWRRFLSPGKYAARLAQLLRSDPRKQAARRSQELGLFAHLPTPEVIDRLVDFGVAHSAGEVAAGRGLDVRELEQRFAGRWQLVHLRSYSFMGDLFEGDLPASWRRACAELQQRFPEDGANACAVWRRSG